MSFFFCPNNPLFSIDNLSHLAFCASALFLFAWAARRPWNVALILTVIGLAVEVYQGVTLPPLHKHGFCVGNVIANQAGIALGLVVYWVLAKRKGDA